VTPSEGAAPAAGRPRRVVIVQELLPTYRVPFFEALRAHLAASGVELTVVHGSAQGGRASRADAGTLPWAVPVANRHLRVAPGATAVWQPVPRALLADADLVVVEQANRQLLNYLLLGRYVVTGHPRLVLWGHGGDLQAVGRTARVAERFKAAVSRRVHWWLAYTEGSADRVAALGFPRKRITVVQNAVAVPPAAGPVDRVAGQCIYVGSLYRHKRIGYLLEAGRRVAQLRPDFRLVVVGDGEDRSLVADAAASSSWLDYRGPMFGQEAADLLRQSTLLLMPGLVGLAVVDSFAAGCPLVTVDLDLHSPEIEYLRDGVNGVCLPAGTGPAAYAGAVVDLLDDPTRLEVLREGCRQAAETYTLAAMVERYADGLLRALE
jgi:glycosyltransferase involved in cell wall biosynthesis